MSIQIVNIVEGESGAQAQAVDLVIINQDGMRKEILHVPVIGALEMRPDEQLISVFDGWPFEIVHVSVAEW